MSFNDLKTKAAQNIVTILDLELDRCRHTTEQSVLDGIVTIGQSVTAGEKALLLPSGGNPISFINSIPYLLWDDEIIKVSIIQGIDGVLTDGVNQFIAIPLVSITTDFEINFDFFVSATTGANNFILGGTGDFNAFIDTSGNFSVQYDVTSGSLPIITGGVVNFGTINNAKIKRISNTVTITINGAATGSTNALFDNIDINGFGVGFMGVRFFKGIISNLKIWTGGDSGSGSLIRDYPVNDGFGADPVIINSVGGNNGTATNLTASSWLTPSDEIINILDRAQFGTTDAAHSAGAATIKHQGEVDGGCYGTPFTCTSPDSYEASTKLLFRFPSTQLDLDQSYFSGYKSWSHRPGSVDPGQSMGRRSGATFVIKDSVDNDIYVPYPDRRTSNGKLFTKLLARHPNFEGRPAKAHEGFNPLDLDFDNFITREYIIDSVQLKKGLFTVSVLDPLILTDDKKAKAPIASLGTNTIAIIDASGTITYTGAPAFDYGVATSTAFVRLDAEVIEVTVLSDFVLTIINRAVGGTEQKDHEVNATVQECLVFTGVNVVEIIEDLLIDFTKIPSTFLDDYTAVKAATASITLTANINKPTSVKVLIDELIKTGDLVVFYDEITSKIKIKQVTDATVEPININEEDHIGQESITFTRDTKNQFTRYTVAWAPNKITETKDEENFSIVFQSINLQNELPENIGEINEKPIFFNRWLTSSSGDVINGTSIAQRAIDRVQDVPEIAEFDLDVGSVFATQGGVLELGSIINLSSSRSVNVDGTPKAANHQVLSLKDLGGMRYRVISRLFQDPLEGVNVDFTISIDKQDYDLSTEFSPAAGNYIILIDTGVTIGGTIGDAFTTGSQVAGVTFDFIIRGAIEGLGGNAGRGGVLLMPDPGDFQGNFSANGTNGLNGGNAFNATVDCTINTGSGAIWAGGGGASGSKSTGSNFTVLIGNAGNGGGGGQGFTGGTGGNAGTVSAEPSTLVDTGQDGNDGSRGTPGITGGISGGEWGESGDSPDGSTGGLGGFAIVSNGNTVTITSGNNILNIKGRRS